MNPVGSARVLASRLLWVFFFLLTHLYVINCQHSGGLTWISSGLGWTSAPAGSDQRTAILLDGSEVVGSALQGQGKVWLLLGPHPSVHPSVNVFTQSRSITRYDTEHQLARRIQQRARAPRVFSGSTPAGTSCCSVVLVTPFIPFAPIVNI